MNETSKSLIHRSLFLTDLLVLLFTTKPFGSVTCPTGGVLMTPRICGPFLTLFDVTNACLFPSPTLHGLTVIEGESEGEGTVKFEIE